MAEQLDYVAFEWVNAELDDTIKQARQALESYSQDKAEFGKLRFTLTHAHQINGTLRMVQLDNLVELAEEIEAVAQALVNRTTPDEDAALEILMTGLLQLPSLLERVKKLKADISPAALEPIVNKLKSVRGVEPNVSQRAVDFSAAFSSRVSREDFDDLMSKLRKMFRVAVLNIARNNDIEKNVRYLAQIGQRIHKISQNTTQEYFWRTGLALFEALEEDSLVISNEVADLLLELDKQLINIAAAGPDSLSEPASEKTQGMIKTLLKLVKSERPLLRDLQKQWEEELKSPSELEAMGPDSATLQSVVDALLDELSSIKDYIDLYVRNADRAEVELEPALPVFARVINTMTVLGLGDALRTVRRQEDKVRQMAEGNATADVEALMSVAENIISVEAILKESVRSDDFESASQTTEKDRQLAAAFQSVVIEARAGIEHSKEAVIEFIAHQWDHDRLKMVPTILSEVRGGLMILPLERAASILASCEWYICDHLLSGRRVPEWQMLDTLADALTSVDYYLERIVEDSPTESDMILDVAVESVAALGFPITDLDQWQRRVELYQTEDTSDDDNLDIAEFMVFDEEFDQYAAARLRDDLQNEAQTAQAGADAGLDEKNEVADALTNSVPDIVKTTQVPRNLKSTNETNEDIDEEILEIFAEEVEEVLLELDEHIIGMGSPESMDVVRRSFHTLKGSGRMVGAFDTGELAWSVENMLNRVIDGSQEQTAAHQELVTQARQLMPALLKDFTEGSNEASARSARLSELADAISTGQSDITTADQVRLGFLELDSNDEDDEHLSDQEDAEFAAEMLASVNAMVDEPETASKDVVLDDDEKEQRREEQTTTRASVADGVELENTEPDRGIPEEQAIEDFDAAERANDELVEPTIVEIGLEQKDTVEKEESFSPDTSEADREDELALRRIFNTEATTHLATIQNFIEDAEPGSNLLVSENLHRALHTLKGSARIAGFEHIAQYIAPLESYVLELHQTRHNVGAGTVEVLQEVHAQVSKDLAVLPVISEENAAQSSLINERVDDLRTELTTALDSGAATNSAPMSFSAYLAQMMEGMSATGLLMDEAKLGRSAGDALLRVAAIQRDLAEQSESQNQSSIASLSVLTAEACEQAATLDWLPESFIELADDSQQALEVSMDGLASGQPFDNNDEFTAAIEKLQSFALKDYQREVREREAAVDAAEYEADEQIDSSSKDTGLLISQWMKSKFEPSTPSEMADDFFDKPESATPTTGGESSRAVFMAATGLMASNAAPLVSATEEIDDELVDNSEGEALDLGEKALSLGEEALSSEIDALNPEAEFSSTEMESDSASIDDG